MTNEGFTSVPGFKVVHINARSLFKKLEELYANLNCFDAISETWLHQILSRYCPYQGLGYLGRI